MNLIRSSFVSAAALLVTSAAFGQITPTAQNRTITGESFSTIAGVLDHEGPFQATTPDGDYSTWDGSLSFPGLISGSASQRGGYIAPDRIVLDQFAMSLGGGGPPDSSADSVQSDIFSMTFNVDADSTYTLNAGGACAGPGGAPDTTVSYALVLSLTSPGGDVFYYETNAENGYTLNISGATGALTAGSYTLELIGAGQVSFNAPADGNGNGAGGGAGGGSPFMSFVVTPAGSACDPDVNQDGNADQDDVAYLINVISGGSNPSNADPDFNHDGNADQSDVDALINVIAGGVCP